ncbi:MAG: YqjF family protein [Candidatus Acidiferrales bacterium]
MRPASPDASHRPWPLPAARWVMEQTWHELLFAHWPLPASVLRPLIPEPLTIDTFDGQALLGVVPFRMSGVRVRGLPALPGLSAFPELNVRTYVTRDDRPGVWFFSLDAGNSIAVAAARAWFHLPYFRARMSLENLCGEILYRSLRTHRGAPPAEFRGRYRPAGEVFAAAHGTLEYFLTERYCLYAAHREKILRADIHHPLWPLQLAEAEFELNTMAATLGIALPAAPPLLHFASRQHVLVWPPREINR